MSSAQVAWRTATTAGINFIKAMIYYSASEPLADVVVATQQRLIREGIDEKAFKACRDLAAELCSSQQA